MHKQSKLERREERIIKGWLKRKKIVNARGLLDDLKKRPLHNKLYDLDMKLLGMKPIPRLKRPHSNSWNPRRWCEVHIK